jgi:hypothetical protein
MPTHTHPLNFDMEFQQYLETALWSSHDWHDELDDGNPPPMDDRYDVSDFAPDALETMRAEFADFLNGADADALAFWQEELGAGQIGHDFWLTRNGHGAGFWDRFAVGIGARYGHLLTEQSKPYGESYVYGDGDLVHVS